MYNIIFINNLKKNTVVILFSVITLSHKALIAPAGNLSVNFVNKLKLTNLKVLHSPPKYFI